MNLGDKILQLRKKNGLSQEQLGEKVDVTRQTISNWELGETTPNPEQLKKMSKAFNVSVDEILDNDSKEFLMNKISNTERLAGIIIKILKVIGFVFIGYIIFMIIAVIGLGTYTVVKKDNANVESSATTICSIDNKKYQIEFGTNNYFKCNNCSKKMSDEINEIVDWLGIDRNDTYEILFRIFDDLLCEDVEDVRNYYKPVGNISTKYLENEYYMHGRSRRG